jgi:hypothetical protein
VDSGQDDARWTVRLSVPRRGGWRAWGPVRGEFERRLADQQSAAVAARVDSEVRRGRDHVRVVIAAAVQAADAAEALGLAWWAFMKAAGEDLAGWDMAAVTAEVRPRVSGVR